MQPRATGGNSDVGSKDSHDTAASRTPSGAIGPRNTTAAYPGTPGDGTRMGNSFGSPSGRDTAAFAGSKFSTIGIAAESFYRRRKSAYRTHRARRRTTRVAARARQDGCAPASLASGALVARLPAARAPDRDRGTGGPLPGPLTNANLERAQSFTRSRATSALSPERHPPPPSAAGRRSLLRGRGSLPLPPRLLLPPRPRRRPRPDRSRV